MSNERYYPETLLRVYFNYCRANDLTPGFEDLKDFVVEIQGTKHLNGIPFNKTIDEVFNETSS